MRTRDFFSTALLLAVGPLVFAAPGMTQPTYYNFESGQPEIPHREVEIPHLCPSDPCRRNNDWHRLTRRGLVVWDMHR